MKNKLLILAFLTLMSLSPLAHANSYNHYYRGPQISEYGYNSMVEICDIVIQNVNELRGYTNHAIYGRYLLPIRKAAAAAKAISMSRPGTSWTARRYYVDLLQKLDRAEPYIQDAFEVDYAFNLAVELMAQREYIRFILQ